MSDVATEDRSWAAQRLFGSEATPQYPIETSSVGGSAAPIELDVRAEPSPDADPNGGAWKAALWLGVILAVAMITIVVTVLTSSGGAPPTTPPPAAAPVSPAAAVAAPTSAPPAPDQDRAIEFSASANCPAGSTSAQSLTDTTRDSAWICVRGQQGARVDGQVLDVDLGGSYVLSAVSVTPGWVAKAPGGKDEWLQHRVVSRLQYAFDDTARTIFTQDTGDAHGPVTTALPARVLASHVTVIVLQTSRPPASPPPSADPGASAQPGFGDSVLGPVAAPPPPDGGMLTDPSAPDQSGEDPVDATFAISTLKFFGHQPM